MLVRFILLFSLITFVVASDQCAPTEVKAFLLSCESSCSHLETSCKIGSKCVCPPGLHRDPKTKLCVSEKKCSNHQWLLLEHQIHSILMVIWSVLEPHLPTQIVTAIKAAISLNKMRKMVTSLATA